MEQVNGNGWFDWASCAAGIVGIGILAASLPATAVIGGAGVVGVVYTIAQTSAACTYAAVS